ncbi:protease modulator HflK [bacterium]|nr:protease modulator HflK [bacterium]
MTDNQNLLNNNKEYNPAQQSLVDALKISFGLVKVTMFFVIISFLCSGVFVVKQHESALILRFGKIVGTPADRVLKAGLHWAWPYPIDKVIKIQTGRVQNLVIDDFWYYDKHAENQPANRRRNKKQLLPALRPGIDGYIICGDVNIIHAKWILRYTIDNPYTYYTVIKDNEQLLKNFFRNSVISVANSKYVDDVLRTGIEKFRKQVQLKFQDNLNIFNCGIEINRVDIDRISPPIQVKQAFDDVIQAEQEHSQKVNEAKSFASKKINQAIGISSQILSQANAYKTNFVEETKADANYLSEILDKYENNPEIFTFFAKQKVIRKIMSNLEDKFIFNKDTGNSRELRLLLNRNPQPLR